MPGLELMFNSAGITTVFAERPGRPGTCLTQPSGVCSARMNGAGNRAPEVRSVGAEIVALQARMPDQDPWENHSALPTLVHLSLKAEVRTKVCPSHACLQTFSHHLSLHCQLMDKSHFHDCDFLSHITPSCFTLSWYIHHTDSLTHGF